jgi:UTP:GlnB (protein PII) uridylyltransferase
MDSALGEPLSVEAQYYPKRGATLVTVLAADHAGLFYRIAGAIHLAGGSIIDARIHTTATGWPSTISSCRIRWAARSTRSATFSASRPASPMRCPTASS